MKNVKIKKKKYIKPKILSKKIKLNYFYQSSRFFDSMSQFSGPNLFAQSGCVDLSCSIECSSSNSIASCGG